MFRLIMDLACRCSSATALEAAGRPIAESLTAVSQSAVHIFVSEMLVNRLAALAFYRLRRSRAATESASLTVCQLLLRSVALPMDRSRRSIVDLIGRTAWTLP
jgi:hypothetical protein